MQKGRKRDEVHIYANNRASIMLRLNLDDKVEEKLWKRLAKFRQKGQQTAEIVKALNAWFKKSDVLQAGDKMLKAIYELQQQNNIELKRQNELLEQCLKNGIHVPESATTGKALNVPKLAMPVIDDEDTIVISRGDTSGVDASANFLNAAFNLHS